MRRRAVNSEKWDFRLISIVLRKFVKCNIAYECVTQVHVYTI